MNLPRRVTREELEDHVAAWPRKLERIERNGIVAFFDFRYAPGGVVLRVADYRSGTAEGPDHDYQIWRELS